MAKITHLIVDSGAFIANTDIDNLGEHIYTLPEVVTEIRDESTRQRLQFLPYELKFREPSAEHIKFVVDFAKKTGDFSKLSVTDLKLIALTYHIEKEQNGGQHLRGKPIQAQVNTEKNTSQLSSTSFAGFFRDDSKNVCEQSDDKEVDDNQQHISDESSDDDDDDDNNGWITVQNIDSIKRQMLGLKLDEEMSAKVSVGCLTGDYAMQNVLMQIGLKVINIRDGLCIRQTRQFVLRCYACFKISSQLSADFCDHCGNKGTLRRVAVTLKDDGTQVIHINYKKPINIRGTRYSLPTPKSGKHSNNPILVADQTIPQHRKSKLAITEKKLLNAENILKDPNYVNRLNPFAINDVYSRSSRLVTQSRRRVANPNETRRPTGNRKKKNNV